MQCHGKLLRPMFQLQTWNLLLLRSYRLTLNFLSAHNLLTLFLYSGILLMFLSFSFRKCSTAIALLKLDMFQKSCQRPQQTLIQSQWNNLKVIVPKSSPSGCLNKSGFDNMKICLNGSLWRKEHDYISYKMPNYTEISESWQKSLRL